MKKQKQWAWLRYRQGLKALPCTTQTPAPPSVWKTNNPSLTTSSPDDPLCHGPKHIPLTSQYIRRWCFLKTKGRRKKKQNSLLKSTLWARDGSAVRTLASLPQDLGSIPSAHTVAHRRSSPVLASTGSSHACHVEKYLQTKHHRKWILFLSTFSQVSIFRRLSQKHYGRHHTHSTAEVGSYGSEWSAWRSTMRAWQSWKKTLMGIKGELYNDWKNTASSN